MTIQHIQLRGERYVILPEREFLELQRRLPDSQTAQRPSPDARPAKFREVTPLKVGGVPASDMLIQDRR